MPRQRYDYQPLTPELPVATSSGIPYSIRYGDIYHPAEGGWAQAEHVFLRGNGLPLRWRGRQQFTVCETGFGLGMNFLALWQAWRTDPDRSTRLHVVSFEAHPLPRQTLTHLLARCTPSGALHTLAQTLLAQWPPLLPGVHRLDFEAGQVTLTLAFGDASAIVSRLSFVADAFFLDGFAPVRNPVMWTPTFMQALADHAVAGATAATWCSAGSVRRGLEAAGFEVERRPGFGAKTHMTVATHPTGRQPALGPAPSHVVVVGAGVAGTAIAYALHLRGIAVWLVDGDMSAQERDATAAMSMHRGFPTAAMPPGKEYPSPAMALDHAAAAFTPMSHIAAALTPCLAHDDNPRARLSRAGCLRAQARWGGLPSEAQPWRCGTVQLFRPEQRAVKVETALMALAFPTEWVRWVHTEEACDLAGISVVGSGLFFRDGMLIRPPALRTALMSWPHIHRVTARIERFIPHANTWRLQGAAKPALPDTPVVILANALGASSLLHASGYLEALPRLAAMQAVAGEVTALPAAILNGGPRCIVSGGGYVLPSQAGWCVAGSTYVRNTNQSRITPCGQRINLNKAAALLGGTLSTMLAALPAGAWPGWAGWRAVLPQYLPALGPVSGAPGVYVATGFGSRGLTWAALAGDVIAAQLCGEPLPLETDLIAAIAP